MGVSLTALHALTVVKLEESTVLRLLKTQFHTYLPHPVEESTVTICRRVVPTSPHASNEGLRDAPRGEGPKNLRRQPDGSFNGEYLALKLSRV
jgi:hypothetical protein